MENGTDYLYMGTAGANASQMFIADGKMYIVRINKVKVYDLDPFGLETTWSVPAGSWLVGLAWDGDNTLYCHDTDVLYSVDMTTGIADTVMVGFPNNPAKMEYDLNEDRLLILVHNDGIWGYDIQTGSYTSLLSLPYHFLQDIIPACGDQWLMTMGFNQGGGMLYRVPEDLSTAGDTVFWDMLIRPKGVYYDAVGDSATYVMDNSLASYQAPCLSPVGIEETAAEQAPAVYVANDRLTVSWPAGHTGTTEMRIVDTKGRLIHAERIPNSVLQVGYRCDIGIWDDGAYVVVLQSERSSISTTFIIAR